MRMHDQSQELLTISSPTLHNHEMATASLSYKVSKKAVKSAFHKVNISKISSLMRPQTRSLFSFFVWQRYGRVPSDPGRT